MASSARTRQLSNAAIFLGPATVMMLGMLIFPIAVDIAVAFSDMAQTVRIGEFTFEQFNKIIRPSEEAWLGFELRGSFYRAMVLTAIFVLLTLTLFNVGFALSSRSRRPPCRNAPVPSSAPSGCCRA